jgi:ribonucleotide reductase alpha subunit
MRLMRKHRAAIKDIDKTNVPKDMLEAAKDVWDEVIELGEQYGFRNAQATVLAPTGTIGFMMDCDTTGVEPDIALVKYKKLVGGGMMKIVNQTVPMALKKLGYNPQQINEIISYIDENETIEGAPHVKGAAHGGVRLRVQADARHAVDSLHGARPDDGRDAAVPVGCHLQDRQRAEARDRRGHPAGLYRFLAHRRQGRISL